MAKTRNCEGCGARMSPYFPRSRREGKMLCKGCQQNPGHVFTAVSDPVPDKHPSGDYKGDFGWENDLAPEGYHPLFAPLPNEIWENYAQKKALQGKPALPQKAQKKVRANSGRRKRRGDPNQRRLSHVMPENEHSHDNAMPMMHAISHHKDALKQHLVQHHGEHVHDLPDKHTELGDIHDSLHILDEPHHSDTGHTHDPHVPMPTHPEVLAGEKTNTGADALHDHLVHEHGLSPAAASIMSHGNKTHFEMHEKGAANHQHGADAAPAGNPKVVSPQTLNDHIEHLKQHHGWTAGHIEGALQGKDTEEEQLKALQGVHELKHELGDPKKYNAIPHEHIEAEKPSSGSGPVANPTGIAAHIQHLVEHHGKNKDALEFHSQNGIGSQLQALKQTHENEHAYGHAKHEHGAPEPTGELPHKMSPDQFKQHLMEHHGLKPLGVDTITQGLGEQDAAKSPEQKLVDWHEDHHQNGIPGGDKTHSHAAPAEVTGSWGPVVHKHPNNLGVGSMSAHLQAHHGLTQQQINEAANSNTGDTSSHLQALHDQVHSHGTTTVPHSHLNYEEADPDVVHGPPLLKHHAITTEETAKGHLAAHHGYDEAKLAGIPAGGAVEHHNALHDPTSPAGIAGGQTNHTHSGHADQGKYFAKTPKDQYALESHLAHPVEHGGHGMSEKEADDFVTGAHNFKGTGVEQNAAAEHAHSMLHATGAPTHQHVPTMQPGVVTPQKQNEMDTAKHLEEWHGIKPGSYTGTAQSKHNQQHDPEAYGYPGHPGHEHADAPLNALGPVTHGLPTPSKEYMAGPPVKPKHWAHPSAMNHAELANHVAFHQKDGDMLDSLMSHTKSDTELMQQHAQHHATGDLATPHTHEGPTSHPMDGDRFFGGKEPEPSYDEHPHPKTESETLAHIVSHHPNMDLQNYKEATDDHNMPFHQMKDGMQKWHDHLHHGEYQAVPDGHTHSEPAGPNTDIAIGKHLVDDHKLPQHVVAGMTPQEFKAYHEDQHVKHDEEDLGHGHVHPGGPVRAPRTVALNPHHLAMRSDPEHPAIHEWYHGTSGDYEGAPQNATELKENFDRWGNFGGGDWNNHAGTHWSSLHQMARNFNNGGNRVIHAKLHMKNPIHYNSLNHMAHDAYDRLHASGDMQDGGEYLNNHRDDGGYNHCCSDALLEYAKGGHRSDGKFGMERYRDSLRASGHDGVVVRNQADSPEGHWNAIPLSADQVEITNGHCYGAHHDERDHDQDEFQSNSRKLKEGWQHPKPFSNGADMYNEGKDLPDTDEVAGANRLKQQHLAKTEPPKWSDAGGYRGDRDMHGQHVGDDGDDEDEDHDQYCEHCDEYTDHDSDDCDNKYCSVCEEHGSHTTAEGHEECDHCGDYADHSTDEHEDEYGEHPETMKLDGYCPHCDTADKENYGKDECTNCGEKLPNWKTIQAHGKPLKPGQYNHEGMTPEGEDTGGQQDSHKIHSQSDLANHLFHYHHSNPSGKEFEVTDQGQTDWDNEALSLHHKHLHVDPAWAKEQGFKHIHGHKHLASYGEYPAHEDMTPAQIHAHLLLGHLNAHENGKHGSLPMGDILKMSSEDAVAAHKKMHDADDKVEWGATDSYGDALPKISHSHQKQPGDALTKAPKKFVPAGQDLLDHIKHDHKLNSPMVQGMLADKPDVAEALHQQMHDNGGPGSEEGHKTYHVHDQEWADKYHAKKELEKHLTQHHGTSLNFSHNYDDMVKEHEKEHGPHPTFGIAEDKWHAHTGEGFGNGHLHEQGALYGPNAEMEHIDPHKTVKSPEEKAVPAAGQSYIPMSTVNAHNGSGTEWHLLDDHPELKAAAEHPGFAKAPGTPEFQEALKQAQELHANAHAKYQDQHNHHHNPNHQKKSSGLRLTDLFKGEL